MLIASHFERFVSRPIRDNAGIMWSRSYLTLDVESPMVASSRCQTLIGETTDLAISSMKRHEYRADWVA